MLKGTMATADEIKKTIETEDATESADSTLGIITNIQMFAINDGPGIRTTVFLKGCRINCRWCHNPEGCRRYPEIYPNSSKCVGCGKCIEVCPVGAISFVDTNVPRVDKGLCIVCKECVDACEYGAMNSWGLFVAAGDVLAEVEKDKPFYDNSGGGMTVSGGEPLAQPEFTLALMKGAKQRNIGTALDTCGYANWEKMEPILRLTDVVLFDIKHMFPEAHKDFCGVTNELILQNAQRIAEMGIPMRIRVPVIPGRNDTMENLEICAKFVAGLDEKGKILGVDLLPYHPYAGAKYRIFGLDYPFPAGEGYNDEEIEQFVYLFVDKGLDVTVGG